MAPSRRQQRPRTVGAAASPRRGRWTHPVVLFVAAGIAAITVLLIVLSWFSRQAATGEAILDSRSVTSVIAHSVAEPAIPPGLATGNAAAVDRFDRTTLNRLLVDQIVRIKIWNADGRIIYSDKVQLIGERFSLHEEELEILQHGGTAAEVSNLQAPENRFERGFGKLLEVYTQVRDPAGRPLLFEAYFPYSHVTQRSDEIASEFRPITVAGLLVFLILTTPLVWVLARRLDRSAADRERLLMAAVEASDVERRRISRDLHDGVVQELAAVSFTLSATGRQIHDQPVISSSLDESGAAVRRSLRALRSLLVEIYPPDLRRQGLAAALEDLLAPASNAGVEVDLDVSDTSVVSPECTALVWRAAQEGVRNAVRHGRPSRIFVQVTTSGDDVRLVVRDDGQGFDPAAEPPYGHLGLRSLRDLVEETGGSLEVTSAPNRGTTLEVRLACR
ncbi:MAG: hypothetical protein QOI06_43 [Nocardioidaceae bacterium]|nr:hypothetical protein [Nocardioidaceae bacterium]